MEVNPRAEYVNNHIHTSYSFSPYTPAEAVRAAKAAGLLTAGIMDHDTIAGAVEFVREAKTAGIAATVGLECRCSMDGTPFEGRRINNPDQKSVAYLALHAVPRCSIDKVQAFITPYRQARNVRNRAMTERLDALFAPFGIGLDYTRDVEPISMARMGGTVTERHILYALALKLTAAFNAGPDLVRFLSGSFDVTAGGAVREKLSTPGEPLYEYHLLGLLKSGFVDKFYIDAGDELPHVTDFIRLALETGAIAAYAYLGDVGGSVTGDKKDAAYEDAYLDELTAWLPEAGFHAVTYMPARNTLEQLTRIAALCARYGLFQISGEDINSPFQSFVCEALADPRHAGLIDAAWAMIGHERIAANDPELGMFSQRTVANIPDLYERIRKYAALGRENI